MPFEIPPARPLELPHGAQLVNTGRNALRLLVRQHGARRVHLPMLGCGVLGDALAADGVEVAWYRIGCDLRPLQLPAPRPRELVVLCDLFGVTGDDVGVLAEAHAATVLDLTHSVLDPRPGDRPWFASYRKTFGLTDGAIAVTPGAAPVELEHDISADRYLGRLRRLDEGPELGRPAHLAAEAELDGAPVRAMSRLSSHLLSSIDQAGAAARRAENFALLDQLLPDHGVERFGGTPSCGPFTWPLKSPVAGLHTRLHDVGVFAPVLWPDVPRRAGPSSDETWVTRHCVPLPVDHHLAAAEMRDLADRVLGVLNDCAPNR